MILYTITTATAVDNTDIDIWVTNVNVWFESFDKAVRRAERLLTESFIDEEAKRNAKRCSWANEYHVITARSGDARHIIKVQRVNP